MHIGPIPTIELRSEDGFGILLMLFDMRRDIFLHPRVRAYIMNPLELIHISPDFPTPPGIDLHAPTQRQTPSAAKLHGLNLYLQEEVRAAHNSKELVGASPALSEVMKMVKCVAGTDSTVLVTGETGTGKELIARLIHALSGRKDKALVKLDCTTIPANLAESELGVADEANLDRYTRQSIAELRKGYRAFAGQRDDGLYADIQSIFDLDFTFGGPNKPFDSQGGFNVHTIVLQIPLSELGDASQAGVYATTSRRQVTILSQRAIKVPE
jgi:hypothetical protein